MTTLGCNRDIRQLLAPKWEEDLGWLPNRGDSHPIVKTTLKTTPLTSRKTLRPGRRGPRRICTQKKNTVGQQTFSTLDTLLNFLPLLLLLLKATQGRKDF